MARKNNEKELRKFSFDISEENYSYLKTICETGHRILKIGPLIDGILTKIRTNYPDFPLDIIEDKHIVLLEKHIEEQRLLLQETEVLLKKLKTKHNDSNI